MYAYLVRFKIRSLPLERPHNFSLSLWLTLTLYYVELYHIYLRSTWCSCDETRCSIGELTENTLIFLQTVATKSFNSIYNYKKNTNSYLSAVFRFLNIHNDTLLEHLVFPSNPSVVNHRLSVHDLTIIDTNYIW